MNNENVSRVTREEARTLSALLDEMNCALPGQERMSQVDMARHMGMSPQALNNFLAGRRQMNLAFAQVVTSTFGITLSQYSRRLYDEIVDLAALFLPKEGHILTPSAPLPAGRQLSSKALMAWDVLNESLVRLPLVSFSDVPSALDTVEKNRTSLNAHILAILKQD